MLRYATHEEGDMKATTLPCCHTRYAMEAAAAPPPDIAIACRRRQFIAPAIAIAARH